MIGSWLTWANFQRHNGNKNSAGVPSYDVDADWDTVLTRWPCERQSVSGGEQTRGRQTTGQDSYTFEGDPYSLVEAGIDETCRIVADGVKYSITHISGTAVMSLKATIEAVVET